MNTTKKILALLLAVITLMSVVSFGVSAETDYNYNISTAFYSYDSAKSDWIKSTYAAGGDSVKMRVSVSTNFTSGPATILLAYDKSLLSVGDIFESGSISLNLNENFSFAKKDIQQVTAYDGYNVANKQYGLGNITKGQFDAYSFIAFSIRTSGCVVYDGSDWLFEVDMTVLDGNRGKALECFVIPETVCTKENSQGFVSFPYAPSGATSLAELTAAYGWYENSPVLESEKVTVTSSPTERIVTWVVDGVEEKVEFYEIGDEITGEWTPEKTGYTFDSWSPSVPDAMPSESLTFTAQWKINQYTITFDTDGGSEVSAITQDYATEVTKPADPAKMGYTFNGWSPEVPSTMPAENITVTAQWQVNSYDAVFNANGGAWEDGETSKAVSVAYNSEISAPESPAKQGYVFAGWSADGVNALDTLGIMDSVNGKSFTALWLASTETHYSVETYMMDANGVYQLSTAACTGTTDETVSVNATIPQGFELNREKSVLSGTVAADNSLVLKVYIDRKTYTFTTVADGVAASADYLYGASVSTPATPSKQGYAFAGWDKAVPSTMPAENVTLTALFKIVTTVAIKNNPGSKTINYGETLRLTAITANLPEDAYVKWYVDGSGVSMSQKADGSTCEIKSTGSGTVTVTAKVVDKNGNPVKNDSGSEISDSQKVVSNAGFWQKIVSFFKNLFGVNRTIIQVFKIFS